MVTTRHFYPMNEHANVEMCHYVVYDNDGAATMYSVPPGGAPPAGGVPIGFAEAMSLATTVTSVRDRDGLRRCLAKSERRDRVRRVLRALFPLFIKS